MNTPKQELMQRYGISAQEAEQLVERARARASIRGAVAAAAKGDPYPNLETWREELQRRLTALEILDEGVDSLHRLKELLDRVVAREAEFVRKKRTNVRDRSERWWDFRDSGWAAGGRELFAQIVSDVLENLDEAKLSGQMLKSMGFKRTIPMAEASTGLDVESAILAGIRPAVSHMPSDHRVGKALFERLERYGARSFDSKEIAGTVKVEVAADDWRLNVEISEHPRERDDYTIVLSTTGSKQWEDRLQRRATKGQDLSSVTHMLVSAIIGIWKARVEG